MKKSKVKIEVFVPLGSCVCSFAPILERVGRAASEVKDFVEVQMKSTKSPEANKYGIQGIHVVVDGQVKLPANFDEQELKDLILRKVNEHA